MSTEPTETPEFVLPELVAYRDRDGAVRPAIVLTAGDNSDETPSPATLRVIRNSGRTYTRQAFAGEDGVYTKVQTVEVDFSDLEPEDFNDDPDESEL